MNSKYKSSEAHDDQDNVNLLLQHLNAKLEKREKSEKSVTWALIYSCLEGCIHAIDNYDYMKLHDLDTAIRGVIREKRSRN